LRSWIMHFLIRIILVLCLLINQREGLHAQQTPHPDDKYRIMFYNVENLFDTYNDPSTNDDEFTPEGSKNWSAYRYQKKLNDIARVIIAAGEWNAPAVVGLCEIENFQVLLDLTTNTPLKPLGYQIVHENSKDARGIDVALLYRADKVKKLEHQLIRLEEEAWTTRDILQVKTLINQTDTIDFFVSHWPSRYGGKEATQAKRIRMATLLRSHIDSLQKQRPFAKLCLMGDFNDEPNDRSIKEVLGAVAAGGRLKRECLYNLSFPAFRRGLGTLVFKEINHTWFLFDQVIVSGALLDAEGVKVGNNEYVIFDAPWLRENGRPYRTYQGPAYKGGYSDHLPVFIDLVVE
jgi:exonuclease III